jgi:hypothetical protein
MTAVSVVLVITGIAGMTAVGATSFSYIIGGGFFSRRFKNTISNGTRIFVYVHDDDIRTDFDDSCSGYEISAKMKQSIIIFWTLAPFGIRYFC